MSLSVLYSCALLGIDALFDAVRHAEDSESAVQRKESEGADCRAVQLVRSGTPNSRLCAAARGSRKGSVKEGCLGGLFKLFVKEVC